MKNIYGEIQDIKIAEAINAFVRFFKESGQISDKTLVVPLRLTAEDYKTNKRYFKEFYLLFHSPSSYTKVGWYEGDGILLKRGNVTEINFEADHDSCWRDGTERIIRRFAEEAMNLFPNKKDNPSVFNSFGILGIELCDFTFRGSYESGKATIYKNKQ